MSSNQTSNQTTNNQQPQQQDLNNDIDVNINLFINLINDQLTTTLKLMTIEEANNLFNWFVNNQKMCIILKYIFKNINIDFVDLIKLINLHLFYCDEFNTINTFKSNLNQIKNRLIFNDFIEEFEPNNEINEYIEINDIEIKNINIVIMFYCYMFNVLIEDYNINENNEKPLKFYMCIVRDLNELTTKISILTTLTTTELIKKINETNEEDETNFLLSELRPFSQIETKINIINDLFINVNYNANNKIDGHINKDLTILNLIDLFTFKHDDFNCDLFIKSFDNDEIKIICENIEKIINIIKIDNINDIKIIVTHYINQFEFIINNFVYKNCSFKTIITLDENEQNKFYFNLSLIILFKNLLKFNDFENDTNKNKLIKIFEDYLIKSNKDFKNLLNYYNNYINSKFKKYDQIKTDITNTLKTIEMLKKSPLLSEFETNIIKISLCHDIFKNVCLMCVCYNSPYVFNDIFKAIDFLKFHNDINVNNYYECNKINVYNIQKFTNEIFANDYTLNEVQKIIYYIYLNYNVLIFDYDQH